MNGCLSRSGIVLSENPLFRRRLRNGGTADQPVSQDLVVLFRVVFVLICLLAGQSRTDSDNRHFFQPRFPHHIRSFLILLSESHGAAQSLLSWQFVKKILTSTAARTLKLNQISQSVPPRVSRLEV